MKEALLAYFFLLGSPQEQDALDGRIEKWLAEPPLNEALVQLDRLWDGFFRFDQAAE